MTTDAPPPYLHPAPQAAEAAAALPPQLAAAPDADDALYTRLEHMNAALVAEGALLFDRIVACETPRGPNYGSPFARTPARYTFWADPAACGSMPLLCFAARMVLVSQGSAMSNERLHSAIGMLTRKLRAKTTPDNAEMFTLARHWLLRGRGREARGARRRRARRHGGCRRRPGCGWRRRP